MKTMKILRQGNWSPGPNFGPEIPGYGTGFFIPVKVKLSPCLTN
jgi:hypothetical protein